MPIIEKSDKFQKWKYIMSELFILYPDGTSTEIPAHRVLSISLNND